MRQRSGKQAGSVQRLHQIVADRREKAGLGLVRRLGVALGLGQCQVELRQFMGAFGHPLLQAFVGGGQGLFGLAERGDVSEAHDKTPARHRVADQFDDPAVGKQPLGGVGAALAHPVQAAGDVDLGLTRAAEAAFCNG